MNPVCRNCHFLAKENPDAGRFSLTPQERETAKSLPHEVVPPYYTLNCYMGVWDEGVSGVDRNKIINLESRKTSCFFFPYHSAMIFDTARELQKRYSEEENLKSSNSYVRTGIWIAIGGLALTALVAHLTRG